MSTHLSWLDDDEPLRDGLLTMVNLGLGAMAVRGSDGKPRGLLVRRDWAAVLNGEANPLMSVGEACREWVALSPDDSLEDALRRIESVQIGRIPVVASEEVVGGISRSEIHAYLELERDVGLGMRDLIREISPKDVMFDGEQVPYLMSGPSALRCISRGMEAAGMETPPQTILDFACGHGRISRFLKIAFPRALIAVADIDEDGVEFCRSVLGLDGFVSSKDPREIELSEHFDLIWCGSMLSHLDATDWRLFLDFFGTHLSATGVLIFTIQGGSAAERLRTGELSYTDFPPAATQELLAQWDRARFGYVDYPGQSGYGISLSSIDWIREILESSPLEVIDHWERAWDDHQDAVTCVLRAPAT
jgi:CBS domain-containing protein